MSKHLRSFRSVGILLPCAGLLALYWLACPAHAQLSFEKEPIHYNTASTSDPIAQLQAKIDSGEFKLDFDKKHEYLPALMEALGIPASSQMLVFSKTSFQLQKINPARPRALYFRDDVYLGWVQQGDVIEVASIDPQLGPIFYTLDIDQKKKPRFVRDQGQCIVCHASSRTQGVPGLLVRSVFPSPSGQPILGSGTFTIDHTSPLQQRWGGWYVTGTHGKQRHMGNELVDDQSEPAALDHESGANVTDLSSRLHVGPYLTPHSDLVALMVLEHQSQMQNFITRANYEARSAKWYDAIMNEALDRPADYITDSTKRRIEAAVEKLVRYLLFSKEAKLTAPLMGTSTFAGDFARTSLRDKQGRSLRDFDLQTRLFKYPCSYLIYSSSFDALPVPIRDGVYRRLWEILTGKDTTSAYGHLSQADRSAILGILLETKDGLPGYWTTGG